MNRVNNSFPLDLLSKGSPQISFDESGINSIKQLIVNTFSKKGIDFKADSYIVSPTVVRFEFILKEKVNMKYIHSCEDMLNEALSDYDPVRLIAPVPGKGTIAVEVPRLDRQIVRLREVLESKEFQETTYKLPIVLGISSQNKPIITDLFWMQDIFIGGMTGMGKSMLMHNIIASLMYAKRPEQLKFVLVNTKNFEFNTYSKLQFSYLATFNNKPAVITDPQDVLKVLDSLIYEKEKRHIIQHQAGIMFRWNDLQQSSIVVIIDEISDLLKQYNKEILSRLFRLVAYGKSSGIHFICASRNCSSNIFSCEILNRFIDSFQTRISFKTNTEYCSNLIIEKPDATRLSDKGDMLLYWNQHDRFVDGSIEHFERIQSCIHDKDEIFEMTDYFNTPQTVPYVLPEQPDSSIVHSPAKEIAVNGRDPLFAEAARMFLGSEKISMATIQSRFRIGYNRAGMIMDQLEEAGIVRSQNGCEPRKVLKRDNKNKKSLFSFKNLIDFIKFDKKRGNNSNIDKDMVKKENDDERGQVSFAELMDIIDVPDPIIEHEIPYEDYIIIGDTAEIDRIYRSNGCINLDIPDFLSTLSKTTNNYVSIGSADGAYCVVNALIDALHKLPIEIDAISKFLFNVWTPKDMHPTMKDMKSMADFVKVLSEDIDVVWGFAFDESMEGHQARVSLIAASK